MDPIKIVVTHSEQSQSATELNELHHHTHHVPRLTPAASSPPSLSFTSIPQETQHHQNNGTEIKSIKKRRIDLPPLKLSTYEPKKAFELQIDDHDVVDECRKLLLNPSINKPFPSSQSTLSLNKRVTISPQSSFSGNRRLKLLVFQRRENR